jgi:LacI family transcriptional regulator
VPRSPVTIVDVAAEAGVSTATVSRALSRPGQVRAELLDRVRNAIGRLGYVPSGAARSLVSRRSNAVGVIVPTVDNAIFAKAIQSLQQTLDTARYRLLVATSEYDAQREVTELQALLEHGVDGIVLVGATHEQGVDTLLASTATPFVKTWTYSATGPDPTIGFDNRAAMARLAAYLLDLGHRRIAMIAGLTRHNDRAAERVSGVRDALAGRGLVLRPELLLERPYSIAEGRAALRHLLRLPQPPTAVVCGNDVLAFGALFESEALNVAVPDRLSITGFDDLDLAAHLPPGLTTMRVPSTEMGRLAAEYLLARIEGAVVPERVQLEAELVVRGSTGPVRRPRRAAH